MATIERVTLTHVSEARGNRENAAAEVEIQWAWGDVGHPFTLAVYLIEQDGRLDQYGVNADGTLLTVKRGSSDDYMGEIGHRALTPHAAIRETETLSREWNFPSPHESWMEYHAVATLIPTELIGDVRVSRMLKSSVR